MACALRLGRGRRELLRGCRVFAGLTPNGLAGAFVNHRFERDDWPLLEVGPGREVLCHGHHRAIRKRAADAPGVDEPSSVTAPMSTGSALTSNAGSASG